MRLRRGRAAGSVCLGGSEKLRRWLIEVGGAVLLDRLLLGDVVCETALLIDSGRAGGGTDNDRRRCRWLCGRYKSLI